MPQVDLLTFLSQNIWLILVFIFFLAYFSLYDFYFFEFLIELIYSIFVIIRKFFSKFYKSFLLTFQNISLLYNFNGIFFILFFFVKTNLFFIYYNYFYNYKQKKGNIA